MLTSRLAIFFGRVDETEAEPPGNSDMFTGAQPGNVDGGFITSFRNIFLKSLFVFVAGLFFFFFFTFVLNFLFDALTVVDILFEEAFDMSLCGTTCIGNRIDIGLGAGLGDGLGIGSGTGDVKADCYDDDVGIRLLGADVIGGGRCNSFAGEWCSNVWLATAGAG